MAEWLELLHAGKACLDAGQPAKASEIYKQGLTRYRRDANATQWFTFNLMQSDALALGPRACQPYLPALLDSGIGWSAKLYAMEMVLASANPGDDNLPSLLGEIIRGLNLFIDARLGPQDINVMSCQSINRHVERLYGAAPAAMFQTRASESDHPVARSWTGTPTAPQDVHCNRWPKVLRIYRDNYSPPNRPLGFRHVGPAHIIRLGENTILFSASGEVLDTPYGPLPAFLKTVLTKLFPNLPRGRRIAGVSLFIGDYFSQALNYCHWLVDGLPRIAAAVAAEMTFDHVIGAFPETAAFQTDSLRFLLSKDQTYAGFTPDDGLVAVEDLYYADNNSLVYVHHPAYGGDTALLKALRQSFAHKAPTARRLYVPRRHSRVVLNENELLPLLLEHGFEIVDTDDLPFETQIEIFSGASDIIGPHGAALTNMLFAHEGCRVLEFFPPAGGSASFYLLAAALGHTYGCYIDDVSQGPNQDGGNAILHNSAGMRIDVDFVRRWLENLPPVERASGS